MSARGFLCLGSKLLAESRSLIPISWLGFLSNDNIASLLDDGTATLERKVAIATFDNNAPFLAEISAGKLDFGLAEQLIARVRSSRAKTVRIEISELIVEEDKERTLPGIDAVVEAISMKDGSQSFRLPARVVVNPADGEKIKTKAIHLKSNADIMYSVCWITERWLKIADAEERESMVTGHIWP